MPDTAQGLGLAKDQNGDAVVGPAHPGPGSDITWTILPKCRIAEGVAVDLVAIHARAGVAILEIGPHWTPEAIPLLRATLAASGFDAACPGNLPVIHRRLRPEDVPLLRDLLAESFLWQPPLTLAEDSDWIARLRGALVGLGEAGPAVEAPGPEPRGASRPANEPPPFDDAPIPRTDPPTELAFPAGAPANGPARSPMAAPAGVATPAAAPLAAGGRSRAVILALAGIGALGALALAQQDLLPGQAVREGHGIGRAAPPRGGAAALATAPFPAPRDPSGSPAVAPVERDGGAVAVTEASPPALREAPAVPRVPAEIARPDDVPRLSGSGSEPIAAAARTDRPDTAHGSAAGAPPEPPAAEAAAQAGTPMATDITAADHRRLADGAGIIAPVAPPASNTRGPDGGATIASVATVEPATTGATESSIPTSASGTAPATAAAAPMAASPPAPAATDAPPDRDPADGMAPAVPTTALAMAPAVPVPVQAPDPASTGAPSRAGDATSDVASDPSPQADPEPAAAPATGPAPPMAAPSLEPVSAGMAGRSDLAASIPAPEAPPAGVPMTGVPMAGAGPGTAPAGSVAVPALDAAPAVAPQAADNATPSPAPGGVSDGDATSRASPGPSPATPISMAPSEAASTAGPGATDDAAPNVALGALPAGDPAPPPAMPAAAAPPVPIASVPPAVPSAALAMLRRGEALLALGDLSGARLFFERAAEAGSGRAALLLGSSFDPLAMAALGARGMAPDPAAARRWYDRAIALGEAEAEAQRRALDSTPQDAPR